MSDGDDLFERHKFSPRLRVAVHDKSVRLHFNNPVKHITVGFPAAYQNDIAAFQVMVSRACQNHAVAQMPQKRTHAGTSYKQLKRRTGFYDRFNEGNKFIRRYGQC